MKPTGLMITVPVRSFTTEKIMPPQIEAGGLEVERRSDWYGEMRNVPRSCLPDDLADGAKLNTFEEDFKERRLRYDWRRTTTHTRKCSHA